MLGISTALGFILLALWIRWRWNLTSTFANLGISGPKPNLIFGNMLELYIKGPLKCHKEWVAKYGKVVGYYRGMTPVLLVADPKLIKNIFVKDFLKFTDREAFNPLARLEEINARSESIVFLQGQKWKAVRSVLTPTFSAMKMRQMLSMMSDSVDLTVNLLQQRAESGQEIDMLNTYQRLTMDVITKTAFGVRLDVQTEEKPKLLKVSNLALSVSYRDLFLFIGLVFPSLSKLAIGIQNLRLKILNDGMSPFRNLREELHDVLIYRRTHPEARKLDLLQLMMDAKMSFIDSKIDVKNLEIGRDNDDETKTDSTKLGSESKSTRTMTDREIMTNAFIVLLGGYDTTSAALTFTSYELAKHPAIQERVYQELKELMETEGKLEYETVKKLQYLDKVFNESLRMHPPVYSQREAALKLGVTRPTLCRLLKQRGEIVLIRIQTGHVNELGKRKTSKQPSWNVSRLCARLKNVSLSREILGLKAEGFAATKLTTRFAREDIQYGSLKIPKGMLVLAPVYQLHHDPDFWQDPEVFDPERFNVNPNTDGITFMPFSVGPRNCIGMRFAQTEAKIALAKVLYNFRLVLPESQKDETEFQVRIRTINPGCGIKLKLEKRTRAA